MLENGGFPNNGMSLLSWPERIDQNYATCLTRNWPKMGGLVYQRCNGY